MRACSALAWASPADRSPDWAREKPNSSGSKLISLTTPACTRQIVLVVVVVSSSSPSSPRTTRTLAPRAAKTPAITSARSLKAQPIQPRPRASWIRQWPKEVEYCRHTDFTTGRTRVTIGRVENRREAEPDTHLGHAPGHFLRTQIDPDTEGLEEVGAATERRGRTVAVLDHPRLSIPRLRRGPSLPSSRCSPCWTDRPRYRRCRRCRCR